ncbi:hypothetical protein BYT27DRAFT_7189617 [Phlegmacium glaucopus]|nr:hypothetical protein BYT27DRAFT_7189617 [Phlegmacium glaucopus]
MDPPIAAPNTSSSHTVYTTASGRALVRQILSQSESVAIEPHDYQCEGICRALDGDDVIATMATGAGKIESSLSRTVLRFLEGGSACLRE